MKYPIRVVISGPSGNIAYSALFSLLSGDVFGKDRLIDLVMLCSCPNSSQLQGVDMEIVDCAFPCLSSHLCTSDQHLAFANADYVILFGALPRGPGMERKDLLLKNKDIFEQQGKVLNEVGKPSVRVLVVGNPANTNAYILQQNAPNIQKNHITALSRLDHNRSIGQLAQYFNVSPSEIQNVFVLGNHSNTMVPVFNHVLLNNKQCYDEIKDVTNISQTIRTRGSKIIEARGQSSAASAAQASLDHMRDWHFGTEKITSCSLPAPKENIYEVPEGLVFSFPCKCVDGEWVIQDMDIPDELNTQIQKTIDELIEEKILAQHE
ncbi:Malate_dehydrogenase [Hexamita inflata]|uniref:Malate_dehydrogenase n=1 Tax=Hexamita inflata TaxID=28002 RepID=A0ABP1GLD3_9EUKA